MFRLRLSQSSIFLPLSARRKSDCHPHRQQYLWYACLLLLPPALNNRCLSGTREYVPSPMFHSWQQSFLLHQVPYHMKHLQRSSVRQRSSWTYRPPSSLYALCRSIFLLLANFPLHYYSKDFRPPHTSASTIRPHYIQWIILFQGSRNQSGCQNGYLWHFPSARSHTQNSRLW